MILEDPVHPPTMRELMTHTAGFTYGFFGTSPVDKMYKDQQVLQSQSLQEMINKLAKIPLLYQPGTRWVYSVSMDIQGYIVEKLSGKSLPDFMQERIFGPLGMKDTGFFVPKEKRNRFATLYAEGPKGELSADKPGEGANRHATQSMPREARNGLYRGGLFALCSDALNDGELNGVRILSPATVLMTSNHLAPALWQVGFFMGPDPAWDGLRLRRVPDPLQADEVVGKLLLARSGDTWSVDPS